MRKENKQNIKEMIIENIKNKKNKKTRTYGSKKFEKN